MAEDKLSFDPNSPEFKALKKKLIQKMIGWGGVSLVALLTFIYAFFFQAIPAVRQYKQVIGTLCLQVERASGALEDHGCHKNLIVNAGEAFLVDAWQNIVEPETMKFHGIGTGAVAAAETDTALGTELTTQYNPDSTRATGSLTEASASVFRTVGTNTVDAAVAITEWGLFTQAATGGGTMFSRIVFSAINLASGDSLQTTWDLTVE